MATSPPDAAASSPATSPVPLAASANDNWRMAEHWPELVSALTDQSIETVSSLVRGLDLLLSKGRLTPAEYKVLAMPAERLKHCGISAQQIVRFQSGRVRQSHEKIDLAYLLECVLQERKGEMAMLGVTLRRRLKAVDILIDPTLGFSLTNAMLDWGLPFGYRIDWRLETTGGQARLWMKVYSGDRVIPGSAVVEDNIHWLLLSQIAASDGAVRLERSLASDGVELIALFRRTVQVVEEEVKVAAAQEVPMDSVFKSVSGAYVVVVSGDAALRNDAVSTLKRLGIAVDGVVDATQAREALQGHVAHLLVVDTAHHADAIHLLQAELLSKQPHLLFIEIGASDTSPHPLPPTLEAATTRIARDEVSTRLGSAVMFALSRVM
jgi:microcompartment protein CcmK/EutM